MKKMNVNLVWGMVLVCLLFPIFTQAQTTLQGKVTEKETDEPVLFGNVALYQKGKLITGTETDFDGNYKITDIKSGKYDVVATYIGFSPQKIEKFVIKKDKANTLDIQLSSDGTSLDEVVVRSCHTPLISRKKTTASSSPIKIHGSRSEATPYIAEGVPIKPSKEILPSPAVAECIMMSSADDSFEILEEESSEIEAGQLTAGEWKDLDNWGFWQGLMKDAIYNKWQKHWSIYPKDRYAIKIVGSVEQPVIDAKVSLLDKDEKLIWTTRTDNQGRAELWANVFESKENPVRLKINYQGFETTSRNIRPFSDVGINQFKIPVACQSSNLVDIYFAVDATGSMGDEIQYLKAELNDVIERAKEENEDLNFRLGSVFYRDEGDAYVTQGTPFSEDIQETVRFIQNQHAGGGGDYPEAVHSALEVALSQDWSTEARSRILFLLLDAPPHQNTKVLASLQKSILEAAKMGIKIIPITASGIGKETEFLMKYFSVLTNSTYVFLTDHSGIGNPHLEPTAEEYNVESLNELMLRLILEETEWENCSSDKVNKIHAPNQNYIENSNLLQQVQYYPNPAKDHFYLDLQETFDQIQLFNSKGQLIDTYDSTLGKTKFSLKGIPAGFYVLQFVKGQERATGKLVVIQD